MVHVLEIIIAFSQEKYRSDSTRFKVSWRGNNRRTDNNTIRENVTINRGTAAKGKTIVGNNNLLMKEYMLLTIQLSEADVL